MSLADRNKVNYIVIEKYIWISLQILEHLKQFSSKKKLQGHFKIQHGPGSWNKSLICTVGGCEAK